MIGCTFIALNTSQRSFNPIIPFDWKRSVNFLTHWGPTYKKIVLKNDAIRFPNTSMGIKEIIKLNTRKTFQLWKLSDANARAQNFPFSKDIWECDKYLTWNSLGATQSAGRMCGLTTAAGKQLISIPYYYVAALSPPWGH